MSTQIQRRRGTTAEHSTFTGVEGEITVDTTKDTAVVHDGTTVGGHPLQKQYPPLGSAAAPTYTFTGDTNTGIYSPGADQVAVATNGTQRLLIKDASQDTLRVSGVNAVVTADAIGSNYPGFRLAVNGSVLAGFDGDGGTSANLFTYAAVPLVFGIDSSERMRITSAGLVGVGTSSPADILHIGGSSNQQIRVNGSGAPIYIGSANSILNLAVNRRTSDGAIPDATKSAAYINLDGSGSSSEISFLTASAINTQPTVKAVIDGSGRVGIGTSAPGYLLDIKATATPTIRIQETTNGPEGRFLASASDVQIGTYGGSPLSFYTNSTEKMRLDTLGRVGIGTTSPGAALDVVGELYAGNGTITNYLTYSVGNSTGIVGTKTNHAFEIRTNNLERCRVDTSGRLLVGTSSARTIDGAGTRLQVEGTNAETSSLSITRNSADTGRPLFYFAKSRSATAGGNTAVVAGDSLGSIRWMGADGSDMNSTAASIDTFVDGTPGANDMPGRLVFSTTADGASSPTERMRITSDGGADFFNTNADPGLQIANSQGAGASYQALQVRHSATGFDTGTVSFLVYTNGNVQNTNGSYTTLSDAKLKENITDAGSQWDDLKAIKIRNWNFKVETGHETHRQIGPIAQELETVCPGLVFETPDRDEDGNKTGEVTKGVNQSVLYMKAVKALQEAMERIEVLEQRLNDAGIN
jgi:hypothetical protein